MNSTVEKELAEAAPVMLIPRLMAMQHEQAMQEDYRRRVHDSHKMGLKALGYDEASEMSKDNEMGNISVANNYYGYEAASIALQNKNNEAAPSTASQPAPQIDEAALLAKASEAAYQRLKAKVKAQQAVNKKAPAMTPQPQTASWKQWVWPLVTVASLLAGGGSALYNLLPDTDTNTEYQFDISSEPGQGITAE